MHTCVLEKLGIYYVLCIAFDMMASTFEDDDSWKKVFTGASLCLHATRFRSFHFGEHSEVPLRIVETSVYIFRVG